MFSRGLSAYAGSNWRYEGGLAELEPETERLLAQHDEGCVAEAIQDAYDLGHDPEEGIRFVAWQLFEYGHSPCRCGQSAGHDA